MCPPLPSNIIAAFQAIQLAAQEPDALRRALLREQSSDLDRAMARLRPEYQEAILQHLHDVPHQEIARRMGVPVNTVRTYLSRGRKELKELLAEEQETSGPN